MSAEDAKAKLPALGTKLNETEVGANTLKTTLGSLITLCDGLVDKVAAARAIVAALDVDLTPPVVVPPPPTPVPSRTRLYVDNGTLHNKYGQWMDLRICESTYGASSAADTLKAFQIAKDLGFNGVAPLPNGPQFTLAELTDMCQVSLSLKMVLGVNVDHAGGMAKLTDPAVVTLLNAQPHVFLECAVELGSGMNQAAWYAQAQAFVKQLRDAGHKSLIKVGSPDGGRSPRFALNKGKDLLAFDPEHNLCFTCQMYWSTSGNWYQQLNGFPGGITGGLAALREFATSGLVFLTGFDAMDDIGSTGYAQLIALCFQLHLSFLWWELALDGTRSENNLVTGALSNTLTATGLTLKSLFAPVATWYDL